MINQKLQNKIKYKALMLDVDGTLVPNRRDGMPSERVKNAIDKAKDKIHIGIVTGRPLYHMHEIFDHLQLSGPSVLNNGIRIIDSVSKKTLWEKPMRPEDFLESIKIAKQFSKDILINDGDMDYLNPKEYFLDKTFAIYIQQLGLEAANKLEQQLSHISTVYVHKMISWTPGKIDIFVTHAEATKQHGILEVAKILGIDTHEIIGVGDAYNDFPLLMACGLKVAMANAIPELKEIADYIAPGIDEDGVVDVIEKFVL